MGPVESSDLFKPWAPRIGPVGGQIVAEVLVGLIDGDGQFYRAQDPEWTQTYGSNDTFTMVDLLTIAGVIAPLP
jgi:hypothetical protein